MATLQARLEALSTRISNYLRDEIKPNLRAGFAANVGDGSATSITVTHNLGTRDIIVQMYKNSADYDNFIPDYQITSIDSITLIFAVAPTANQYRVVISKV